MQNLRAVSIAEAHPIKREGPGLNRKGHRLHRVGDRLRSVQDPEHPTRGRLEDPDLRDELRQPLERIPELADVIEENDENADRHSAVDGPKELVSVDEVSAIAENDRAPGGQDRISCQGIELLLPVHAEQSLDAPPDSPAEAAKLPGFAAKRLGQWNSGHRLLDETRQIGIDLLRREGALVDAQPETPVAPDHERGHGERGERKRDFP